MAEGVESRAGAALWAALKDEELLKWRICDLKLALEGSGLESRVQALYAELDSIGLRKLRPDVYLGDEWFSPEGMLAIAVPFYLAHPRLAALEQRIMLEVEGGSEGWFMKLLRHEAGHCFDHAYGFSKRRRWREIFGSPDQEYAPETYRPRPYSKSYVHHLENWYSQAHPDEDFAETFAVYLTGGDWRKAYAGWHGALQKLEYVEELVREAERKEPRGVGGYLPFSASRMRTTLDHYYARRRRENAESYPDFYDVDLRRIFNGDPGLPRRDFAADRFMKKHRKVIVDSVSYWSGERKYPIEGLVRKLTARCEGLGLRVGRSDAETHLEIAAYLATLVTHYLFTGKFKRTV